MPSQTAPVASYAEAIAARVLGPIAPSARPAENPYEFNKICICRVVSRSAAKSENVNREKVIEQISERMKTPNACAYIKAWQAKPKMQIKSDQ